MVRGMGVADIFALAPEKISASPLATAYLSFIALFAVAGHRRAGGIVSEVPGAPPRRLLRLFSGIFK